LFNSLGSIIVNPTFATIKGNMKEKNANNSGKFRDNDNSADVDINSDADVPGTGHLSEPLGNDAELEKLEKEAADWKDKYVRLVAEFDNFRRRTAKEICRRQPLLQTGSGCGRQGHVRTLPDSHLRKGRAGDSVPRGR